MDASELEAALYELEDVVSARVMLWPDRIEVDILTKPAADAERVAAAALEAARAALPAVDRPVEIRALPLGAGAAAVLAQDAAPPAESPPVRRGRAELLSVLGIDDTTNFTAEVSLRRGEVGRGRSTSSLDAKAIPHIVGEATLAALGELSSRAVGGSLYAADKVTIGDQEVVVAVVAFPGEPVGEVVAGIAPVRGHGAMDAAARAVLAAVNRRVERPDAPEGEPEAGSPGGRRGDDLA